MGIEASLPLTVDAMTRGQIARRRKLLDAVVQLVAEVGPERVQMRDVAERSGVALGTAYRYFSSKDHLLAAAMSDWQERLAERVLAESAGRAPRPVDTDGSPMERVLRYVRRELTGFQRQRPFAELMVGIIVSTDPFASEAIEEMTHRSTQVMDALMVGVDPEVARVARMAIEASLMSELTSWVTGRSTITEAFERTEAVTRLVLSDYA